jgi:hypothetical protein
VVNSGKGTGSAPKLRHQTKTGQIPEDAQGFCSHQQGDKVMDKSAPI